MDAMRWAGLFHAEGPADDTPGHLAALLGDDEAALTRGYTHLWSVTLRQEGRAWPATGPTALLAADLLDDPRLDRADPTLPDALLVYLYAVGLAADLGGRAARIREEAGGRVGELAAWTGRYLTAAPAQRPAFWADGTGLGELVLDRAALACFDLAPALLDRVLPYLGSDRPARRAYAAAAVGVLARHPAADAELPRLRARLAALADSTGSPHHLATTVTALAQLGGDTHRWLAHPHLGVRTCAALAPHLAADPAAARLRREFALHPAEFVRSFGDTAPPTQFQFPDRPGLLEDSPHAYDPAR
ncbi:hypothetical protein [Kitasatospora sp. NPDC057198]|uniref:hypothetical protein n=1 Tax=Kitasatospora sp. NPDC057198 TaxID=3346046 RepID=UPI00363E00AF